MTTAQDQYTAGYRAAQTTIAMLEGQLTPEAMRRVTVQNIIPIHHRDRTDYDHGCSDAWADHQAQQTYLARVANRRRNRR